MFSPLQSIMHDGGSDHVDGLRRSTSMKLELDSVDEFTSGFHGGMQHGRAVIGRGAATANHRRRCFSVVPQKPSAWGNPTLCVWS
jgi:hypothetical protein